MTPAILIAAGLIAAVVAFEARRKWRDRSYRRSRKRDPFGLAGRSPIWMGYDHGYDPYAACDRAARGEAADISTSTDGDA